MGEGSGLVIGVMNGGVSLELLPPGDVTWMPDEVRPADGKGALILVTLGTDAVVDFERKRRGGRADAKRGNGRTGRGDRIPLDELSLSPMGGRIGVSYSDETTAIRNGDLLGDWVFFSDSDVRFLRLMLRRLLSFGANDDVLLATANGVTFDAFDFEPNGSFGASDILLGTPSGAMVVDLLFEPSNTLSTRLTAEPLLASAKCGTGSTMSSVECRSTTGSSSSSVVTNSVVVSDPASMYS